MSLTVAAPRAQSDRARAVAPSLRPKRRLWLLILSLLSMVVCAGAFALVYLGADSRVQVLAVARPVMAGQTITAADLRVVRVVPDTGVLLVSALAASRVIGGTAAVPLTAGSLLTQGQVGAAGWPPSGQAVVAVPVKVGRLAAGVSAGVRVLVISVAKDTDAPPAPSAGATAPVPATVVQVAAGVDGSGTSVVSLLVSQGDAVAVAGGARDLSIAVARG
jgi:hypothetical protein